MALQPSDGETHGKVVAYILTCLLFFFNVSILIVVIWIILRSKSLQPPHTAPRSFLVPQLARTDRSAPPTAATPIVYSSHPEAYVANL